MIAQTVVLYKKTPPTDSSLKNVFKLKLLFIVTFLKKDDIFDNAFILFAIVANVAVDEVVTPLSVIAFATNAFPSLTKPKGHNSPKPPNQALELPVTNFPLLRELFICIYE